MLLASGIWAKVPVPRVEERLMWLSLWAVAIVTADQPQQHGVGGVEREAWIERLVVEHRTALRENVDLRARCASLEAVVEAAKGIALRQSPTHQALRQALAALNATTTQEGTH